MESLGPNYKFMEYVENAYSKLWRIFHQFIKHLYKLLTSRDFLGILKDFIAVD